MAKTAKTTISCGFGSLMDIDKLIPSRQIASARFRFGSLMDIDKLILSQLDNKGVQRFGSLMDIDKLILEGGKIFAHRFWFSDGY